MILKKIYFLLLSAILAGVFGYFYNMNIKDNWHSRFNLKYNPTAIIYLKSLDENLTLLGSKSAAHQNLFEFVGPKVFNYREFYNLISKFMKKTRVLVPIPFKIAKIAVSILEKTPISPLNSEQLKLFEKDNLATNKYKNLRDIEVIPQDLTEIIKKIVTKSI